MLLRSMFKLFAPKSFCLFTIIFAFVACGGGSGDSSQGGEVISAGNAPGGVNVGGPFSGEGGDSNPASATPVVAGGSSTPSAPASNTGSGGGGGSTGGSNNQIVVESVITDSNGDGSLDGERTINSFFGNIDSSNSVQLQINLANATAFQVVSFNAGGALFTQSLTSPDENIVISSNDDPIKTLAVLPVGAISTLNYQTSETDLAVTDGSYIQNIEASFNPNASDFFGFVIAKNDSNFSQGVLPINVFIVGNEAQNESTRLAINMGAEIMRSIYQQSGISLQLNFIDVNSDFGVIPNPGAGSAFFTENASSSSATQNALNLYVGETISADNTEIPGASFDGILGISSSIPGPAINTPFSAVAISILEHQGPDGAFSNEEISVFGETFAHESGHYLGLFHPVETDFVTQDPLEDTAFCSNLAECSSTGVIENLMFPSAVEGVSQRGLTAGQSGVMNRHLLVN